MRIRTGLGLLICCCAEQAPGAAADDVGHA